MSDMYIYVYFHLYKNPFSPCTHRIVLNHFAYFDFSEELPPDSIRQIYYCDRRDNARSRNIGHPISAPSLSDDVFSLIVSSISVPSSSYNSFVVLFHHIQRLLIRLKSCTILKGQTLKLILVQRK